MTYEELERLKNLANEDEEWLGKAQAAGSSQVDVLAGYAASSRQMATDAEEVYFAERFKIAEESSHGIAEAMGDAPTPRCQATPGCAYLAGHEGRCKPRL
ncbi:hypothetical protein [Luteibacter sp. ME-Dv--P-043b]|uniref:hypothetical protein n=1 Tax=Luteibacter sp. ME-Dv--P-043b TaxID=3040291 RepID=UPI0025523AE3|nr:hypothetical protein [Luteibacter sp. ME-Dv--P-043b]